MYIFSAFYIFLFFFFIYSFLISNKYFSTCISINLLLFYIFLFFGLMIFWDVTLPIYLYLIQISLYLSIFLSVNLSIYLSIYIYIYINIYNIIYNIHCKVNVCIACFGACIVMHSVVFIVKGVSSQEGDAQSMASSHYPMG